ncbi:hypothetical protein VQ7734_00855 [Vibrio quintilis]|uniref:Uncharacterized protein n=1 Tax=Vibrio quintilis TaxID=1117707 RepID=A0A1M7YRG5_9VIBR|nr:hypothetical protein VQ7734_00855 [Vibrio quintilis]
MKPIIVNTLLLCPPVWFIYIWCISFFNIDINMDFMPELIWVLLFFLGTPSMWITGSIYTFYKKSWYWFGVYMFLGGIPVATYFILSFIHAYL